MRRLLELDPKNKKAQEGLNEALAKSAKSKPKKGHRVQIEEVDEEEVTTADPTPPPNTEPVTSSAGVSTAVPMPQDVVEWKEKGNELFRKGQYGEAVSFYTKAVQRLEEGNDIH